MITDAPTAAVPPEIFAEMQEAAAKAARGVRNPEAVRRARASMDRIREDIRKRHGILNIGVSAIRELRDE